MCNIYISYISHIYEYTIYMLYINILYNIYLPTYPLVLSRGRTLADPKATVWFGLMGDMSGCRETSRRPALDSRQDMKSAWDRVAAARWEEVGTFQSH